ncbi:MAG: hypothetical protein EOO73_19795 [Myxococcales bacterium]|nr:MAG: hypothetical protein EOO73_19795 [Myxococcales bacterium]
MNRNGPLLLLLLGLAACSRQAPAKSYDLVVRVEADPGQPVAGVKLLHGGQELGATGVDGRVVIRATGNEGERVDLDITCPAAYRSPEAPLSVTLRRATGLPEYFAACKPLARKLVVAARLERGAGLPIRYLGREVARTDASGVAHCVIEGEGGKTVELTVDTTERPLLRPKSPTARFRIAERDELVVMEQAFQSSAKPVVRAQRPTGPVRIR